jgi:hypothetical protein
MKVSHGCCIHPPSQQGGRGGAFERESLGQGQLIVLLTKLLTPVWHPYTSQKTLYLKASFRSRTLK